MSVFVVELKWPLVIIAEGPKFVGITLTEVQSRPLPDKLDRAKQPLLAKVISEAQAEVPPEFPSIYRLEMESLETKSLQKSWVE